MGGFVRFSAIQGGSKPSAWIVSYMRMRGLGCGALCACDLRMQVSAITRTLPHATHDRGPIWVRVRGEGQALSALVALATARISQSRPSSMSLACTSGGTRMPTMTMRPPGRGGRPVGFFGFGGLRGRPTLGFSSGGMYADSVADYTSPT